MRAVIFTEAGKNFGLGHLSRCVALGEYLVARGFEVKIYMRGDYKPSERECEAFEWLEQSARKKLSKILREKPLVFVDSYYADMELCEIFAANAKVCVFFDDFNRMPYPKDSIILNGALGAKKYYIGVENRMFVGIEYCLLRREFMQPSEKIINKDLSRILITLGGSDVANNTQKVLEIVEKECPFAIIDIVVSGAHSPISYGFNATIHAHLSPEILRNLMLECDVAISGGGVTMVEIQSTQTPSIALLLAPNQAYQLRAWRDEGLRVAENIHQIKSLLKGLRKFKDRKKLHNRLSKIKIGEKVGFFIDMLVKEYNS